MASKFNKSKKLDFILEFIKNYSFLLIAGLTILYFFFTVKTHPSPYFEKYEVYELGMNTAQSFFRPGKKKLDAMAAEAAVDCSGGKRIRRMSGLCGGGL